MTLCNYVRGYQNYLKSVVSVYDVEDGHNRFLLKGDTLMQYYILPQPRIHLVGRGLFLPVL